MILTVWQRQPVGLSGCGHCEKMVLLTPGCFRLVNEDAPLQHGYSSCMPKNESVAEGRPAATAVSRRELAVARVLDPARARAETRIQRFLDAALELMNTSPDREFTVQEVVERSGQSLRSFYQYFEGKYELLVALFEDSVRSTAEILREQVAEEADPLSKLHRFAVEYYRLCRPATKGRAAKKGPTALAQFAQQLLTDHPQEASRAFVPLLSLLEELLDEAAAAGDIRPGLRHDRVAGVILQAIMFNAFTTTISASSGRPSRGDAAEELWDFLLHGVSA
jgi:AcrR family transcriptional regulator